MASEKRKNFLLGLLVVTAVVVMGYFLWVEMTFENERRRLNEFCQELKIHDPLASIQIASGLSPHFRLILMEANQDGLQSGSISSDGAIGWSCNVTFSKGRLMSRSFGGGGAPGLSGQPGRKLKSW